MDNHQTSDRNNDVIPPAPPAEKPAPPPAPSSPWAFVQFLLVVVVGLAALVYFRVVELQTIGTIGIVALGLSFVIFIHELGHFLVAKWCDVHVEAFSIGFGPALPGCSFQRGETTYMIAWFPLGGYVKMVGEGAEEDDDTDPRSFKNKSVWQRMAIISAGVIMNVILGCICFIIAYMHGVEQAPGVVGMVDPGSPAWQKGAKAGEIIYQIGDERNPFFEDMLFAVVLSGWGDALQFQVGEPGQAPQPMTTITPRLNKGDTKPSIGIGPPSSLQLVTKRYNKSRYKPVRYAGAASQAEPPFEFGDVIIGTTDPDKGNEVTELPKDPRDPHGRDRDFFQFRERLHRLAGQSITIEVQREGKAEPVKIQVPASYHWTLGLRMKMGEITAVREGAASATAGVKPGDILKSVEVQDPKKGIIRWVALRSDKVPEGTVELDLDPLRLPYEMEQWARQPGVDKKVKITVLRLVNHQERTPVVLETKWEDGWDLSNAVPFSLSSPLAVPGLGIAYRVQNTVEEVRPGSSAVKARKLNENGELTDEEFTLKPNDVIKGVRFFTPGAKAGEEPKAEKWIDLEKHAKRTAHPEMLEQWPYLFWTLQNLDVKDVGLRVERDGKLIDVQLTAVPADGKDGREYWPMDERGLNLIMPDLRIQKATNVLQAMQLGGKKTYQFIIQIYQQLRSMFTGRVSVENLGGPILIAKSAFLVAEDDFYRFLLFLGMISVNLAVINFLPIPVLDGGHMVFLIYEKLRGKPASEPVRVAATYVGLFLIVSLVVFVCYLDLKR